EPLIEQVDGRPLPGAVQARHHDENGAIGLVQKPVLLDQERRTKLILDPVELLIAKHGVFFGFFQHQVLSAQEVKAHGARFQYAQLFSHLTECPPSSAGHRPATLLLARPSRKTPERKLQYHKNHAMQIDHMWKVLRQDFLLIIRMN